MNDVTVVWSFHNREDDLQRSIGSVWGTTDHIPRLLFIDAASSPRPSLETKGYHVRSPYRLTLPEGWNLGLMLAETRYVVFASVDVLFLRRGWLEALRTALDTTPYVLMQNHAVFGLDRAIVPKIGWFDERYGNGPHFDTDYMLRATEHGPNMVRCIPNEGYYHHGDDAATTAARLRGPVSNRLPMHTTANEQHFKSKWNSDWPGWLPGNTPHPPNNISKCARARKELDPHPAHTARLAREYSGDRA